MDLNKIIYSMSFTTVLYAYNRTHSLDDWFHLIPMSSRISMLTFKLQILHHKSLQSTPAPFPRNRISSFLPFLILVFSSTFFSLYFLSASQSHRDSCYFKSFDTNDKNSFEVPFNSWRIEQAENTFSAFFCLCSYSRFSNRWYGKR